MAQDLLQCLPKLLILCRNQQLLVGLTVVSVFLSLTQVIQTLFYNTEPAITIGRMLETGIQEWDLVTKWLWLPFQTLLVLLLVKHTYLDWPPQDNALFNHRKFLCWFHQTLHPQSAHQPVVAHLSTWAGLLVKEQLITKSLLKALTDLVELKLFKLVVFRPIALVNTRPHSKQ